MCIRDRLCPFQYFGVTDTADLSSLKWRTGGYDKNELSNLYTLSGMVAERRADLVVSSILKLSLIHILVRDPGRKFISGVLHRPQ